jgi:serine beta-lactamase-like protein LACTB
VYDTPTTYRPEGCLEAACAEPLDAPSVTLRDLLQHAGAAPHYDSGLTDPVPPEALRNDPEYNTGIAWALPFWVDQPAINVPGTTYHYSTMGYNLAGAAVESAGGAPLGALVAEHIATPLGMTTLQTDPWWEPIPDRAVGYWLDDGRLAEDGDTDVSWKLPGGGFLSTGEDLTRWCAGLLTDAVLPRGVRDDVLWTPTGPSDSYALGFGADRSPGARVISHSGSQEKAKTAVLWYPDEGLCFTVMSNTRDADPWALVAVLEGAFRG